MATNTIALLARPAEIDPLEVPTKQANLKQLALQNAEGGLKLDAARQDLADNQSARAALQADPSGGDGYLKGLATAGNVKGYFSGLKANADTAKTRAEAGKDKATTEKTELEAINLRTQRYRDALNTVGDQASAAAWVHGMYADPHLGPVILQELGPVDQALARIPDPAKDPQGFAAWKRGSQLGAEKLVEITKPVVGSRQLGDRVENTLTDPTTGAVTVTGQARMGQSPDTAATIAQRERESMRTDTRERELNPAGRPQYDAARGVLVNTKTGAATAVVGPDGKPLTRDKAMTEFQGKSAAFGDRAAEADRIIGGLEGQYSPAAINSKASVEGVPLVGGMMGAATNKFALSDKDQQAEQAQRDFINAILRQESGAAIGASEFDNARKQYFTQPGDSAAVIAQKARNRKLAIDGLQRNAGSNYQAAATRNPAPAASTPPTNAKGWALHVDAAGNKAYVSPDGTSYEEVR